jgi:RHS repeat-associated protein
MSDDGSGQLIALPRGGGAVRGIGEAFRPDLHTGTGTYTVPLELPAGRAGLAPALALGYSTGRPNGHFGLGWTLDLPAVRRKTDKGVPRYDAQDVFAFAGSDLAPVPGAPPGEQRYRPRVEDAFARITRRRGGGQDYWEVRGRDGVRSTFGTPRPADALDTWRDPAAIADPDHPDRVCAWLLSANEDPLGNRVEYDYEPDPPGGRAGSRPLRQVRYNDHPDPDDPRFLVRVRCEYEDRPDPFTDRRPGFPVRTTLRCRQIQVWIDLDPPALTRTVDFEYADGPDAAPNGISLLRRIVVSGHDGDAAEALPSLEFGYSRWEPQRRERRTLTAVAGELPRAAGGRSDLALADLFGDGLPSILQLDGTARYWRNRGNGRFDPPRPMPFAPGAALGTPGVLLADFDGDGRMDLLVADGERSGYWPLARNGGFDPGGYVAQRHAPSVDLTDPLVRLADLDGDGVIDALRSADAFELFYNDRVLGWARTQRRQRGAAAPDLSFDDPRVKVGDMTGDGLADLVLVNRRRVEYWPYLGHGRWDERVVMRDPPSLGDAFDPRRVLLGDVDGDGCADLLYVEDGRVTVWLNQSGGGFADPVVVAGTPRVGDPATLRLEDVFGTGTPGVLWTGDETQAAGGRQAAWTFLDLTGGRKPYLLTSIDNHLGAGTSIEYAPSSRFALADAAASSPWRTTLPFPVHVVSRITVRDYWSQSETTSELHYHDGLWDGDKREFRGFGRVDQLDAIAWSGADPPPPHWSPPVETRTWFHLGPATADNGLPAGGWPGDPPLLGPPDLSAIPSLPPAARREVLRALSGRILRTELYARDGDPERQDRPYTVTEHRPLLLPVLDGRPADDPGWAKQPVVACREAASRATQWERGDDPRTSATFAAAHDPYGQPQSTVEVAAPRGRDVRTGGGALGEPYLATVTILDRAQRDEDDLYLVDRVARARRFQVGNDGALSLPELAAGALDGTLSRTLRHLEVTYFDGPAFEGLTPAGQLGRHGLAVRTERLALTPELLAELWADGTPPAAASPAWLPAGGAAPAWTDEHPEEFRQRLPALGGYRWKPADGVDPAGWWVQERRARFDVHDSPNGRGLPVGRRDPLGGETTIGYDEWALLPVEVRDPVGLVTTAANDGRVLRPRLIIDPNGNRTLATYTPLGMLAAVATLGKPDQEQGDTAEQPGTRYEYALTGWEETPRQPASVQITRRVEHRWTTVNAERARRGAAGLPPPTPADLAALFPADERDRFPDRFVLSRVYSDGFGRLLQERAQADDVTITDLGLLADPEAAPSDTVARRAGPGEVPVVVSGWQRYDNKGRPVERYEPAFGSGWAYAPPDTTALGLVKLVTGYDPRGETVRVVHPDGSEERHLHGEPAQLDDPSSDRPSPWLTCTYDPNDNAGRSHPAASSGWQAHWNTPRTEQTDPLGRIVLVVERNGTEEQRTVSRYDIDGNLLEVVDPLGRVVTSTRYDLLHRPWRVERLDAGVTRLGRDAAGEVVERRDAKGALGLVAHDPAGRPLRRWSRDRKGAALGLREAYIYGDDQLGGPPAAARDSNLLGRPWLVCDEAGTVETSSVDLNGNVLATRRRVLRTDLLLSNLPGPAGDWSGTRYAVDWTPPAAQTLAAHANTLLEPDGYELTFRYDAVGRRTWWRCPQDVTGGRVAVDLAYGPSGGLASIQLDGRPIVQRIVRNARGQRLLVVLGNGVIVRHRYDPATFRLQRLRSERGQEVAPLRWRGGTPGDVLQDCGYAYDLVGNLLTLLDRTPGGGVAPQPDAIDRQFAYDPLYRLLSATGRECPEPRPIPWSAAPACVDPTATRRYIETYAYDAAGTLRELSHQGHTGTTTRTYTPVAGGNRLATAEIGAATLAYAYDPCGNLTRETTSRRFEWDSGNRLATYRTQADGADPSLYAQYRYDTTGRRVSKLVRRQGGEVAVTVTVDGLFERLVLVGPLGRSAHDTVHVLDGAARVALLRVGPPAPGDQAPAEQYQVSDHLESSTVVLDAASGLVSREEFTPYGETSFGSHARKRYRYTGKERDEESGLDYFGARYYAAWLCRWTSRDPNDGRNGYDYADNDPIGHGDPDGRMAVPALSQVVPALSALARAAQAWGSAAVITGGAEAGAAGGGAAAAAGTGAIAAGPVIVAVAAVATVAFTGVLLYKLHQAKKELAESQRRGDELKKRLDQEVDQMWRNGRISYEQLLLYRNTGSIPGVTEPGPAGEPAADPAVAGATASDAKAQKKPSKPNKRPHNQAARRRMEKIIRSTPGHLLAPLINPATGKFWSGRHGEFELPAVQMGHGESLFSSGRHSLLLEDADFNQLSNWTGESQGVGFEKPGVTLMGIPVELRTARLLERQLQWPAGTVDAAPPTKGWEYP